MDTVEGNYIKAFDAIVTNVEKDYVVLDKTAFYPLGGGQPSDTGIITWEHGSAEVKDVIKKGDSIRHTIKGDKPEVGMQVHGEINWQQRYAHMRMHTAQHIISGVVFDHFQARTVGNQIHAEFSRVDFHPLQLTDEDIHHITHICNNIISQQLPITIYTEERKILEQQVDQQRCNFSLLPKHITRLRIVEIRGFDICPCAGTHVKNTSELVGLRIIKKENKGKQRERIIYTLE
jgi:misacylated tRNA(Ala) deacylase